MTTDLPKQGIKEMKVELEAGEKEDKDGTLHIDIPSIANNALPATRLLETRRLMFLVHDELERKKVEFEKKEEILQKQEDALHDKDIAMQESLISFSKFLQESAIKKKRAEKKSQDEIRLRLEKEQEILVLEDALLKLKDRRTTTLAQLDRMMIYDKYLKDVLEKAPQFHEIHDLMQRHATLEASHNELRNHIDKCDNEIDSIEEELQHYLKNSANTTLVLNNDVTVERQKYEQRRLQTTELQKNIDSMLETIAAKTLARSQFKYCGSKKEEGEERQRRVTLALLTSLDKERGGAENLFYRIDKASVIARPVQDNPIKNLDMVGDYITDLAFIAKAYKLDYVRKQTPTSQR